MFNKFKTRARKLIRRIRIMKNWYAFVWPLNRFGKWPKVAVLRSGARITINALHSSSYAIFNEIAIDDVYNIEQYGDPKRIIDVGANIGIFSVIAAKRYPNAEIISFEPEDRNFKALEENIRQSGAKNATVIKKAVSSEAGKMKFYLNENNPGAHTLFGRGPSVEVEVTTLPQFLPADVLKLDAEGAEYKILKTEIPDCSFIVLETHQGDDNDLFERLERKYDIKSDGEVHVLKRK